MTDSKANNTTFKGGEWMDGAIIIATKTSEHWGFRKGDTLKVRRSGVSNDLVVADNLTRPNYGGQPDAILHCSEYKVVSAPGVRIIREKKFLGMTIYREIIKEAE
jgi:hypothetical protein